jgi:hypothetical protein
MPVSATFRNGYFEQREQVFDGGSESAQIWCQPQIIFIVFLLVMRSGNLQLSLMI